MAKIAKNGKVEAVEDEIRDIINWVAVFETEYGLDKEVVDQLRAKLESLSKKVSDIS